MAATAASWAFDVCSTYASSTCFSPRTSGGYMVAPWTPNVATRSFAPVSRQISAVRVSAERESSSPRKAHVARVIRPPAGDR